MVRNRRLLASSLSCAGLLVALSSSYADPVSELASFSVFPRADLVQLSKAPAKPVRNEASGNSRHLGVQTAYVVPAAASRSRGEDARLESGALSGAESLPLLEQRDRFLPYRERAG
jgi:hypothetical protein